MEHKKDELVEKTKQKTDETLNRAKDFAKEQTENLKNIDMKEIKKKWSWKGFFFNGFYYAGKGELKKGLILVSIIGLGGLLGILFSWLITIGVWIYAGLKAREELNLENKFNWKNVGIAVGVYFVISMLVFMLNGMFSGDSTSNDTQSLSSFFSSNNPPKYEGEDLEVYGKKVGTWLGKKWQDWDVKTLKKISVKSQKLKAEIKNRCKANLSKEELLKCFDEETGKVLEFNKEYLNLSVDDFKFINDPVDYYNLEEELTPRQIGEIRVGINRAFVQLLYSIFVNNGYEMPILLGAVDGAIISELKIFSSSINPRAVKGFGEGYCKRNINDVAKFVYIIENSKYRDIMEFNDKYKKYKEFVQACKEIGVEAK